MEPLTKHQIEKLNHLHIHIYEKYTRFRLLSKHLNLKYNIVILFSLFDMVYLQKLYTLISLFIGQFLYQNEKVEYV